MQTTTEQKQTKVLLVEDHPMFRERVAHLINKAEDMLVCGETDNIQKAMEMILETKPDIAIVDLTLNGANGLELIKNLKAHGIQIPVLVLSMHDETLYAQRVLRAGARGYITKQEASSQVMAAIRRVLSGDVYLSDRLTAKILAKMTAPDAPPDDFKVNLLTDRELEIFQLIGNGFTTREISEKLNLGLTTIDTYRARIKEKLELRSGIELFRRASEWAKEQGT
jgi:DNA-binding NarL/FixJ family response regulator